MTNERRQILLKLTAAACAGVFLLDYAVVEPALRAWAGQGSRIETLRRQVGQGRQLLARESSLRERWKTMQNTTLPAEDSAAETLAAKAIDRWARESQVTLSGYTSAPWQNRDEGFKTFECRVIANGTQAALGRFLYELESDPTLPVNLEDCELSTRDTRGTQLTLTARITFLRLKDATAP